METEPERRLPFLEWGIAERPLPGQAESGDRSVVHPRPGGALLAVINGLGHGAGAAEAARVAADELRARAGEPLVELIRHCHEALRRTTGAVMNLAAFRPADGLLSWL